MNKTKWITTGGPLLLTLALLTGMTFEKLARPQPQDAEDYHRRVRQAVLALPADWDGWHGVDEEVAPAALAMLKPNVIISRRYVNTKAGVGIGLLFEQCRDARDMLGHYPPVCYPANGWTQRGERELELIVGGQMIRAREYDLARELPDHSVNIAVINLFVLPDGRMVPDMKDIGNLAADYRTHFYGAGQIQLVFAGEVDAQQRRETAVAFLETALPVIQMIRHGVQR